MDVYSGDLSSIMADSAAVLSIRVRFLQSQQRLHNILKGYCCHQPFFKKDLATCVKTLITCLKDPGLPMFEMQVLKKDLAH